MTPRLNLFHFNTFPVRSVMDLVLSRDKPWRVRIKVYIGLFILFGMSLRLTACFFAMYHQEYAWLTMVDPLMYYHVVVYSGYTYEFITCVNLFVLFECYMQRFLWVGLERKKVETVRLLHDIVIVNYDDLRHSNAALWPQVFSSKHFFVNMAKLWRLYKSLKDPSKAPALESQVKFNEKLIRWPATSKGIRIRMGIVQFVVEQSLKVTNIIACEFI